MRETNKFDKGKAKDVELKTLQNGCSQRPFVSSNWHPQRKRFKSPFKASVKQSDLASVFSFSLTPCRHDMRDTQNGYWLHMTGVFGRRERSGLCLKWCRFAQRVDSEIRRVAKHRGISEVQLSNRWDHPRFQRLDILE
ncbi:MAG: hypothetical protein AAF668_11380 [Pseudomonadota bacterium]